MNFKGVIAEELQIVIAMGLVFISLCQCHFHQNILLIVDGDKVHTGSQYFLPLAVQVLPT